MHERAAIRQAIVEQLVGTAPAFRTRAHDRVTSSRLAPARVAQLPTINVYTLEENVSPESHRTAPRELERTATIAVEAWVAATAAVDDELDALALEIEAAMDLDVHLGDTAFTSALTATDLGLKLDGDRPMGCARLEFTVVYHSDLRAPAPTTIFDTAGVALDLSGQQDPADQPHDLVVQIHG